MEAKFITLTKENIGKEHICCAFSDKKCTKGYELKKEWLSEQFAKGLTFRRLDERAKVFIEYVDAENAWAPVDAPDYLMLGCFWVAGSYKGNGYGKALLSAAVDDARKQGKNGLTAIVGTKKISFMSDGKWLNAQGFEVVDHLDYGIDLVALRLRPEAPTPRFRECVRSGHCPAGEGLTAYYSARCPYTAYYVEEQLPALAARYGQKLNLVRIGTLDEAQSAPTPHTIFTLYRDGLFVTTDLSVCAESRFAKTLGL